MTFESFVKTRTQREGTDWFALLKANPNGHWEWWDTGDTEAHAIHWWACEQDLFHLSDEEEIALYSQDPKGFRAVSYRDLKALWESGYVK